jgi:N-acetylmuramoyl-L-alanine amidase
MKKSVLACSLLTLLAFANTHLLGDESSRHRKIKFSGKPQHGDATAIAPPKTVAPTKFDTVVIDAGHGGPDPGGIQENIIAEKDVTLDVALRLSYALQDAGLKTVCTRSDDVFVTLEDRVAMANAQPNAIFVSIHFNAAPRREARGVETYYSKAVTGGEALAARIEAKLAPTTTGDDRGVKSADYYVLRKNKDLSVLVECGFLTNPDDAHLAIDNDYRQKIADLICAAIVEYRKSLP